MQPERERTTLLFIIASAIGLFTFREMERRQQLQSARDEVRRDFVDAELAKLNIDALGHRERSAMVRSGVGFLATAATIIVGVGVLYQIGVL